MAGYFSSSRLALIFRRLRGRYGVAAPRVAIRTHIPWYLRGLIAVCVLGFSFALAGWTYDVGRRMAGFDQGELATLVEELRQKNVLLEEELRQLRSLHTASESSLQIEQAAQKQLAEKNAGLEAENARLKEEVAVFERLSRLEGRGGHDSEEVSLDRLTLKPEGDSYRFGFLIALQGARRGKETKLGLQIHLTPKGPAPSDKIVLPRQNEPNPGQYEIVLRNFRYIEGKFSLPAGFVVGTMEIKIVEAGMVRGSKKLVL